MPSDETEATTSRSPRSRTRRSTASSSSSYAGAHRDTGGRKGNKRKNRKRSKHPIIKWTLIVLGSLIGLGIIAFAVLYFTTQVPDPEDVALSQKTTVYYSDGTTPIGTLAQQNRDIIECSALPGYVGNSVVSSENRTFWTDNGLDFRGIGRALLNNVTTGSRQGGSTITQQYAERYYLGQTESYLGKIKEAMMALKIAQTQDKSAVLCNYMNVIYWGRDSYGIEAASENYFGKKAEKLTYSEAALLAGIIPSPNNWDPAVNKSMAKARWKRTLSIMKEDGYITATQFKDAKFPSTIKYTLSNVYSGYKGYLLQMVKSELTKNKAFTENEIETGGYSIISTFDKTRQAEMQTVGATHLYGVPDGVQQGGISVNPQDGSVYAVYAGSDYLKHPLNNATQAQFQPGSTMKPFALIAAAEKGVSFNTVFNGNSPRTFSGLTKSVSNDGGVSYGYINLYTATAKSVNTVFMDLNEDLTPQVTASTAHKAGISEDIDETSPYNVLGINGLTAWDLAQGHSTIANDGLKTTMHVVKAVKNAAGKNLYNADTSSTRVFSASNAALVLKAMQGVVTSGTGREASSLGREIAGKTGTSNDGTAVSFVGSTPNMVTVFGVWYPDSKGNPQKVPTSYGGYYGSAYPAHLYTLYSRQAFQGLAVETFPTATDTGKIGGPNGNFGTGTGSSSYSYGYTNKNYSSSGTGNSSGTEGNTTSGSGNGNGSGNASGTNSDSSSSDSSGASNSGANSNSGSDSSTSGSNNSKSNSNSNSNSNNSSGSTSNNKSNSGQSSSTTGKSNGSTSQK
ncbi:MAG: penicillin-binding protein [Bifidobacteriaceae bacterium]|nr:penicillin-binding protein [Bifidobacteriaceae bacterium]